MQDEIVISGRNSWKGVRGSVEVFLQLTNSFAGDCKGVFVTGIHALLIVRR